MDVVAFPDNFTIAQGAGGASTVTVSQAAKSPKPGSDVKLTVNSLPTGISAFFTPVDANGRSTIIVSATKSAATGPVKMTINAGPDASTAITLNVIHDTDPDFAPSVLPGRVTVSQGSDNACDVTLSPANGFASPVTLTLAGVPPGVTASFDPVTTTTKSTLHFTASKEAGTAGTPITIVATSDGVTHTARVMLSVDSRPDFSLSPWADRVSMSRGSIGTDTVKIDSIHGFSAPVALLVSGLPNGVTGHFSPALAKTGSSTLLLTSDNTAVSGSTTITITAKSGGFTHQRTINLDLQNDSTPSFTVTAWPASLTVPVGGRAANTVHIVRSNGFDGLVDLSITGLPDGVTANFSPASTHGTSTLTLSARAGVSIGTPITALVTGMSAGVSHTFSVDFRVGDQQASQAVKPANSNAF